MNTMGKAWQEWLKGIERQFRFFKISEAMDKKDVMIIYGENEIAPLEKSLPDPETGDVYTKLRTKLADEINKAYEVKRPFYPEEEETSCPLFILEDEAAGGQNYKRICREIKRKG